MSWSFTGSNHRLACSGHVHPWDHYSWPLHFKQVGFTGLGPAVGTIMGVVAATSLTVTQAPRYDISGSACDTRWVNHTLIMYKITCSWSSEHIVFPLVTIVWMPVSCHWQYYSSQAPWKFLATLSWWSHTCTGAYVLKLMLVSRWLSYELCCLPTGCHSRYALTPLFTGSTTLWDVCTNWDESSIMWSSFLFPVSGTRKRGENMSGYCARRRNVPQK